MKTCRTLFAAASAVFLLGLSTSGHATSFDKLVVFGDSLSDGGNAFNMVNSPIFPNGFPPPPNNQRNSNGLVAVEYLAQRLGVDLIPSTEGGTNYAVSGAMTQVRDGFFPAGNPVTTGNYADPVYGASQLRTNSNLISQVSQFLDSGMPFNPSSTLFVVWAGANDFFFQPEAATIGSSIVNITDSIGELAILGARRFLIPNLPDLSRTPAIRALDEANPGLGIALGYQQLSYGFNLNLGLALNALEPQLAAAFPGLEIIQFDVLSALEAVLADPAALGLTNVTQSCNDIFFTETCANPDEYLFWDPVHPTDVVHAELGRQFAQAVPEPSTYALSMAGLVLIVAAARRVRRA